MVHYHWERGHKVTQNSFSYSSIQFLTLLSPDLCQVSATQVKVTQSLVRAPHQPRDLQVAKNDPDTSLKSLWTPNFQLVWQKLDIAHWAKKPKKAFAIHLLTLLMTLSPTSLYSLSFLTSSPSLSMKLSDHRVLNQPWVPPIYLNKLSLDGSRMLSAPIWEYKVI